MTPGSDIHNVLQEPTERLIAALSGPCVDTQAAADVGGQLIAEGFTGPQTLPRTFEVLGTALRGVPGEGESGSPCDRVIELLGALASGYVWALRSQQDTQHDELKRTLFPAGQDSAREEQARQAWFRQVFDRSPAGITISELDGQIVHANRSMEDVLGLGPGELVGRHLSELFAPGQWTLLAGQYRGLVASRAHRLRVRSALRRPDDTANWVHLDASLLRSTGRGPQHVVTMTTDITDQYLLEQQLTHQALHDLQTGLPNRQYLTTHLERVLARLVDADTAHAAQFSEVLTLLHLDLDGFTAINDGLGPEAGDHLLEVVARRLEGVLANRPGMVARLGTDEFAILLEPCRESTDPVPEIGALAEAINTELSEPLYLDETGVALTATIGAIQRHAGEASARELMRAADATLRRVRGLGTRQWGLYDPDLDGTDRIAFRLAAGLPGALETGELQTTYQPVVTLEDQRLVGVEAAVCWAHPQSGLLSHDQCVHAAEQTGAVHELGEWLLRTAAEQAVRWRESIRGDPPPVVVNLTPSQVRDPDLVK
ncbi:MAG: diguanylate cyclase domain-containing protein, partial [Pseudonocardiaceae bacterium]